MILKGFFRNILFRVVLITLTSLALVYVAPRLSKEFYFTLIGLVMLLLLQVYLLAKYLNQINNNLSYLLASINDENFTFSFKKNSRDSVSDKFQKSLENVRIALQDSKIKHQKKDVYLENIVTHIGIGLFLLNENGEIDLLNPAAKALLKIEKLNRIDELEKVSEGLSGVIKNLLPSKPMSIKINIGTEILHLLFKVSVFKIDRKMFKLVSLQNIKDELERNELDSWQKLIKVFTHEIINTVTPIVSLSVSLKKQLSEEFSKNGEKFFIKKDVANRTLDGLETIEDTSKGLLNFVSKYRDLTTLPKPDISYCKVSELFDQIQLLLHKEFESEKISFSSTINPENLKLNIDKNLIELAIINLIKNAITALEKKDEKRISLKAYYDHIDRSIIELTDNGSGIKPVFLEEIFTPFFSTKDGGTGIGLSLCRQIMRTHNGKIMVSSNVKSGTVFKLIF